MKHETQKEVIKNALYNAQDCEGNLHLLQRNSNDLPEEINSELKELINQQHELYLKIYELSIKIFDK